MGWTYFYAGTMLVCVEYSAVATVIQYWGKSLLPFIAGLVLTMPQIRTRTLQHGSHCR